MRNAYTEKLGYRLTAKFKDYLTRADVPKDPKRGFMDTIDGAFDIKVEAPKPPAPSNVHRLPSRRKIYYEGKLLNQAEANQLRRPSTQTCYSFWLHRDELIVVCFSYGDDINWAVKA